MLLLKPYYHQNLQLAEMKARSVRLVYALHVHHAVEVVVDDIDPDKDALSQTVDLEIWSWERTRHWWLCRWRSCKRKYKNEQCLQDKTYCIQ